ncbi:unnamed protein product [Protopolystoma xenopodis]|uniref:Uncharacterized protein n=1 Tax=Protopolystoma xenopodis TaxID=117903 RepID=A0A3S4ZYS8_9PLAT|nr:unnamed protein product [Protopolystoma xenopodis]
MLFYVCLGTSPFLDSAYQPGVMVTLPANCWPGVAGHHLLIWRPCHSNANVLHTETDSLSGSLSGPGPWLACMPCDSDSNGHLYVFLNDRPLCIRQFRSIDGSGKEEHGDGLSSSNTEFLAPGDTLRLGHGPRLRLLSGSSAAAVALAFSNRLQSSILGCGTRRSLGPAKTGMPINPTSAPVSVSHCLNLREIPSASPSALISSPNNGDCLHGNLHLPPPILVGSQLPGMAAASRLMANSCYQTPAGPLASPMPNNNTNWQSETGGRQHLCQRQPQSLFQQQIVQPQLVRLIFQGLF